MSPGFAASPDGQAHECPPVSEKTNPAEAGFGSCPVSEVPDGDESHSLDNDFGDRIGPVMDFTMQVDTAEDADMRNDDAVFSQQRV